MSHSAQRSGVAREAWMRARQLAGRPFVKRFAGVLAASTFSNLAGFVLTIVAARLVGPGEFGLFAAAISLTMIVAQASDLGLGVAIVRAYRSGGGGCVAEDVVVSVLGFRLALAAAIVPAAFGLRFLVEVVFPPLAAAPDLTITAIVTGGLLNVWGVVRSAEQARQRFRAYAGYTWALGALRLVLLGFVLLGQVRDNTLLFAALYTGPIVLLLAVSLLGSSDLRRLPQLPARTIRERLGSVARYGAWVAISALMFSLLPRLPQVAIGRDGSKENLGLYSAALTFLVLFSYMNDAIRTVLLPGIASMRATEDRRLYHHRMRRLLPVIFAAMTGALAVMALLQRSLLGDTYRRSIPVFLVLGAGTCVTMLLGLYNILMHSYGIPRVDAFVNLGRVLALGALLSVLDAQPMSVAIAYSAVLVAGEAVLFWIIRGRMREETAA